MPPVKVVNYFPLNISIDGGFPLATFDYQREDYIGSALTIHKVSIEAIKHKYFQSYNTAS